VEPLLFLVHRLPYPPTKGDKVRSFHFLKHLAHRYRVYLGTFVDDPADWPHVAAVRAFCEDACVERISRLPRLARTAGAFLHGEPITLPYFRSRALQEWVRRVVGEQGIERAFVYSSSMAQYVIDVPEIATVVDFVDMDSAKWSEYASRRMWPASALFQREARCLLAYEKAVAARASASVFVTEDEKRRFLAEARDASPRIFAIPNGVDSDYFSPFHELTSPFAAGERAVVFTGAMDYWPNIDAVIWFAREVLPALRERDPRVRFYVVGMNPDVAVRALASDAAVVVTGRVPDVRPYVKHASVVVAPLRVARGIQNKILEAMAMAKAVVTTRACAGALKLRPGVEIEVADERAAFAGAVASLLDRERAVRMGAFARSRVVADYGWRASLESLEELLSPQSQPQEALA